MGEKRGPKRGLRGPVRFGRARWSWITTTGRFELVIGVSVCIVEHTGSDFKIRTGTGYRYAVP